MKKKIKNLAIFIALLLASTMIVGSIYYSVEYSQQDFDQLLFYMGFGATHTSPDVVNNVIGTCIIPVVLLCTVLYVFTINKTKTSTYLILKIRKKQFKIQIYPVKLAYKHRVIYTLLVILIGITCVIYGFKIDKYLKNLIQESEIYDNCYVNGRELNIEFPEEKQNLIIIIAESMENTLFSKENGGAWEYSVIPELEKLAMENTSFSNTSKLGGGYQTYGTSFSAGGIVGITSGTPLVATNVMENNIYSGGGRFLPGVYSLGDILKENGYNLEVMLGSDGTFGGRTQYFNTHGEYKIFDVNYAIQNGKMKLEEKVWWGFEDDKVFEWSKEEITELAKKDEPFNYIMVTADTHFPDGYLSANVEDKFETQYENVYAYSSKSIYEFVEWLKAQEFYENTTIVIVGDHLGMQTEFYEAKTAKNYNRTIYNVIINPVIEAKNYQNRQYTTLDLYPTILASIGVEIEGDRIGLGTNLYSEVPTLSEELSYTYLNGEIQKKSTYYNLYLLGEDYYNNVKEMQQENEEKNE